MENTQPNDSPTASDISTLQSDATPAERDLAPASDSATQLGTATENGSVPNASVGAQPVEATGADAQSAPQAVAPPEGSVTESNPDTAAIASSAAPNNDGATSEPQQTDMQAGSDAPQSAALEPAPTSNGSSDAALSGVQATSEESPAPLSQDAPQSAPAPQAPTPQQPQRRAPSMAQVMESDEFSTYMSGADTLQRGAILRGTVVRIDESRGEVLVDVQTKSEGIISRSELGDEDVNIGDEIEVVVLRPEDDEGHPVLSKRRADYEKTWRGIQDAKATQATLEGTVVKEVKGGLIVNLGVEAFVPASQVDARHRGDLSRFVGRTVPVRVIEIDRKKNKVIASHKLAAAEDRQAREAELFEKLTKGEVVEGIVRRITDFGAFVDIGGVDGLLHVREMGWARVEHPDSVVKKGQKLQLLVLEIDPERKRVALGLKQLLPDPWKKAAKAYPTGELIKGKIARIAPTCAFVELEDGVEAILPISEMSEERIKAPEDVISVGQEIEARVKQNQSNQRRIVLSLRAAVQERERRETRTAVREVNARATGGGDEGLRLGDVFGSALRVARDRGRERNEQKAQVDRKAAKERALEAAELEEDDFSEDASEDVSDDNFSDDGEE